MLKTSKRPIALALALIMCFALLSGIVLPEVAETALAVSDPYARITATDNGDGTYTPDANIYFINTAWESSAPAASSATFDVAYGNGVTWGNGVTYHLTYMVNAFPSWYAVRPILRGLDPASANNPVLVFFPGEVNATANMSDYDKVDGAKVNGRTAITMTAPADPDTATEADYLNVWMLGPQAGKSPVTAKGDTAVANGRSVNNTREFVFTDTFWRFDSGVIHMDGLAGKGTFNWYAAGNEGAYVAGLYVDNFYYAENSTGNSSVFHWGGASGNVLSTGIPYVSKVEITNSYFWQTRARTGATEARFNGIAANHILLENCFFNGFRDTAGSVNDQQFRLNTTAGTTKGHPFLGDDAGEFSATVRGCTFHNITTNYVFYINYSVQDTAFDSHDTITFDSNRFSYDEDVPAFLSGHATGTFYIAPLEEEEENNLHPTLNIINNDVTLCPLTVPASRESLFIHFVSSTNSYVNFNLKKNIVRGDFGSTLTRPLYKMKGLVDVSGNLFTDYAGNVHAARAYYNSGDGVPGFNRTEGTKVLSDLYMSDDMAGGVAENFTVQDTDNDLLVAYCRVLTYEYGDTGNAARVIQQTGTAIPATVTVVPENGKSYPTANLFKYNNPDIVFDGVYSDAACNTPVATLTKNFGTLYAKAHYTNGRTTCTVQYTIVEPTVFRIADPTDAGTYTFNGDTFTNGYRNEVANANVIFYGHRADTYGDYAAFDACSAATNPYNSYQLTPQTDVVLLMPGEYRQTDLRKSICVIGPGFGKPAAVADSSAVGNSRSTSASTEAVFHVLTRVNFSSSYDLKYGGYVSLAGVTCNTGIGNTGTAWDGLRIQIDQDANTLCFLTVQDVYNKNNNTAAGFVYNEQTAQWSASKGAQVFLHMDRVYDDGRSNRTVASMRTFNCHYVKVENSVFVDQNRNVFYGGPINAKAIAVAPSTTGVCFVNNRFDTLTNSNSNNYILGYCLHNSKDRLAACRVTKEDYPNGVDVILKDNRFLDIDPSTNAMEALRILYGISDLENIVIAGNRFESTTTVNAPTRIASFNNYYALTGETKPGKTITIRDNVTVNYSGGSTLYNLDSVNNVNVDDNAYLRVSNGAEVAIATSKCVGTAAPAYAWMDAGHTYKNDVFALADGGFDSVTQGSDMFSWNASGAGAAKTASDIAFADPGVSLVGVYSDFGCTTPVASISSGDTVYVRAQKGSVISVQTLTYTSAWAEIGLAPASEGQIVNVPEDGSVLFLSPDNSKFTGYLVNSDGTPTATEPNAGDYFYAKMPTTGFIYKLKYGVNASAFSHANTRFSPTIVLFPGNYTTKTAFDDESGTTVYSDAAGTNEGYLAIGSADVAGASAELRAYASETEWRIVGPYLGVEASCGEGSGLLNGRGLTNGYEAVLASDSCKVVPMNNVISEGGSLTIDGIGFSGKSYVVTATPLASNLYTYNYNFSIDLKNVVVGDRASNSTNFFRLFSNGGSVGNTADDAEAKNKNTSILTLNIDNSHFTWDASTASKGLVGADFINIRHTTWMDTTRQDAGSTGLYINPTRPENYANTSHKPAYLAENNYLSIACGTLFTIGTSKAATKISSSTRAGIDIIIRDNIIVDSCISNSTGIRSAIATTYASSNQNKIISWTFTGNTVTNTSGENPVYGALLYAQNSNAYVKSADISNNVISGYPRPFEFYNYAACENNLFFGLDGRTPYVIQPRSGYALRDVALYDYDHWASDFNITAVAGDTSAAADIEWPVNAACTLTQNFVRTVNDGLTTTNPGLTFQGDNVVVKGVYTDAALTTPAAAGTLTPGTLYYVKAGYNDSNTAFATIKLYVEPDFGATPRYNGDKYWIANDAKDLPDGTHVSEQVLEGAPGSYTKTAYVFTVGENVFDHPNKVPAASAEDTTRNIYLFPQEYTIDMPTGSTSLRGVLFKFYGAKHGVSPVTLDGDGIPTSTRNAARTSDAEESIISYSISANYQTQLYVDGVAFGGTASVNNGARIVSTSATASAYTSPSAFTVTNCITVNAGTYLAGSTYAPVTCKAQHPLDITLTNNHIVLPASHPDHELLVSRCAKSITAYRNYAVCAGNSRNFMWMSSVTADSKRGYKSFTADIHHNNTDGNIPFDSLSLVDSSSISIHDNRLAFDSTDPNDNSTIRFYMNDKEHTAYDEMSVSIADNIFEPTGSVEEGYVAVRIADTGESDINSFTVSGNTFDNTSGIFGAAIFNESRSNVTVSGNTFIGFKYNFGSNRTKAHRAGGCVAFNYADPSIGETAPNVTIASDNTFNGQLANYVDGTDTLGSHMTVGDAGVDDGTHIALDFCGDEYYIFEPGTNMMVKATVGGVVYYNIVPVGTRTFTAQLCSVDGTPVGSAYTVTILDEILNVSATTATCVIREMDPGETGYDITKPYAATFVGNISVTSEFEFLPGAVDMKIVDYGMYYSNVSTAFDDFSLYENDALIVDGNTVAVRRSCAYNAAGLESVYQNYSYRFKCIVPGVYRYGKMYVTYKVGDNVRTVYSDTIALETPSGAPIE